MIKKTFHYDKWVDARAMVCPMPLLKVKASLLEMRAGDVLRLDTLDTGSKRDIPHFVDKSDSCALLALHEENNVYSFWIEKQP